MIGDFFAFVPCKFFIEREQIVNEKTYLHDKCRIDEHEWNGIDIVRGYIPQNPAFTERLAHKSDFEGFQVSQAAMDYFGSCGGCRPAKIAFFHKRNAQSPARGIIGNSGAGNTASDHENIE